MSAAAACVVLGLLVALLIKTKAVKFWGGLVCIVFGITLAASPIGPTIGGLLAQMGTWAYDQLRSV
jgi:hypothetical protein